MEIPTINPNKSPKQVHQQVSRIAGKLIDRAAEVTALEPEVDYNGFIATQTSTSESLTEPRTDITVSSSRIHAIGGDSVSTSKNNDAGYVGKKSDGYGERVFVSHRPADKDGEDGVIGDSDFTFDQAPRLIGPKKHSASLNVDALSGKIPQSVGRTLGKIRSDISEAKLAQKAKVK